MLRFHNKSKGKDMKTNIFGVAIGLVMLSQIGYAKNLFDTELTIGNQTISKSYKSISDVSDEYDSDNLSKSFPSYQGNEAVLGQINLRGAAGTLNYEQGSNVLHLSIAGLTRTYGDGTSRDQAQDAFSDEIKKDKELLKALSKYWVEQTATDPVAGNGASSLTRTAAAAGDIQQNMVLPATESGKSAVTSVGLAPRFGRYSAEGYHTNIYTLPIFYSHWFEGQKVGLALDLPLTLADTEGSLSGNIDFGVGLNFKLVSNENFTWYLMPMVRTGITGSADTAAAAWTYGVSLASNVQVPITDRSTVSVMNIVSKYKTEGLKVSDYDGGYDLDNTIFRNGVEYSYILPSLIMNRPVVAKLQYAHTNYSGDQLYTKSSHELSGSLGIRNTNPKAWINDYRIGFTANYDKTVRDNAKGFSANLGYTF